MKKTLLTIAIVFAVALIASLDVEAKKEAKASAAFAVKTHDFGNIKEANGPVSCEFTFTNAGSGNLIIYDATAECGCTRPEYPKNPIAPGKSGKIKVTYNPAGRPGAFEKTVTVKANGKPSKIRLKIKGNVIPKR